MKHNKLKLAMALMLVLMLNELQAQETFPASGGDASGSGGKVSYTIGQIIYTTITGTNGSVAQGVQQPYEISVVSGIKETNTITLQLSIYPNPTSNFLILNIGNYNNERLSYQLFDNTGKLLENNKITKNESNISTENLAPAIYFLKVTNNQKEIKTFKIIKK